MKDIQTGKEELKVPLFVNDMTVFVENREESTTTTKNLQELIRD